MLLLLLFLSLGAALSSAQVLPAVRDLQFSPEGRFDYCRAQIVLDVSWQAEDRFAAELLRDALAQRCGSPVTVTSTMDATRPAIFFKDTHEFGPLPGVDEKPGPESREAYRISTQPGSNPSAMIVEARSSAGLYYAAQTLVQLVRSSEWASRAIQVHDWPAMPYRGFMMDTAHGALPTEEEVKRQIEELARWKGNQYYFYFEANLEMNGYPLSNRIPGWSQEQVKRIVAFGRQHHVDVVPCAEFYGHLHDLFALESYGDQSALPHGGEIDPRNEKAQSLVRDWMGQVAALFPSPWLHLGFDEPWELERAAAKRKGGPSPDALYLDHLRKVATAARELGKRPMFWADVTEGAYLFQKYPNLAAQLPAGLVAVPWYYDAVADYGPVVAPFAKSKVPQLVAPGVSSWEELAPDFESTFTNIDGLIHAGQKVGALGVVNTAWSDSAQVLHRAGDAGLAYGAIAAWQPQAMNREPFFSEYAAVVFGSRAGADAAKGLALLAQAQAALNRALGRETAFRIWDDPFAPIVLERSRKGFETLKSARRLAEQAWVSLSAAAQAAPGAASLPSLLVDCRMVEYASMKFISSVEIADLLQETPSKLTADDVDFYYGREFASRNHSRVADLMDIGGEVKEQYREAWLSQYGRYRLNTAMARWDAEIEYWRAFQGRVWLAMKQFKTSGKMPGLEALRTGR